MPDMPARSDSSPPAPRLPASLRAGLACIRQKVHGVGGGSGVYRMLDAQGRVLYVGKARNLQARVTHYTRPQGHSVRIARMIAQTRDMVFVRTATESDALLLEVNLIKKFKPRFNVLMRDDKSLPYILLTDKEATPRLVKHRGRKQPHGKYFGPFASAGAVNRTLNTLQRAFLLRSCSDSVFRNRSRPCLLYQIKRCSAPCTGEIAPADYAQLVREAHHCLAGKSQLVQKQLGRAMQEASDAQDFEHAARLRDRIKALTLVQAGQGINPNFTQDVDVLALAHQGGQSCVQVFFYRAGQNLGNRAYFPRHEKSHEPADILESFVGQFYDARAPAGRVLLNYPVPGRALLAAALSQREGRRIRMDSPQRGEAAMLCRQAERNAASALAQAQAAHAAQAKLLQALAEEFGLPAPPQRIEVYDNSHMQGAHPLGAMIVAGPQGFMPNQYRRFNIRDPRVKPGDDYAMLREVLERRVRKLAPDHRPDLMLVDGGKGQLRAAQEVLDAHQLSDIACIAIAKGTARRAGEEQFFCTSQSAPGRLRAHPLPPDSPLFYYLQRLRDEAHRFAIGSHRARRAKALTQSPLDEIDGIGRARKQALLHHFGSAKAVRDASARELEKTATISKAMAARIYNHFHPD